MRELSRATTAEKPTKSVMHVHSCCFADINLLVFFQFFLTSPASLPKLPVVAIQKFCYHGNVTSHFSSLYEMSAYEYFFFNHRAKKMI